MTVAHQADALLQKWDEQGYGIAFNGHLLQALNYADDFVFLAKSAVELKSMFVEFSECLSRIGLEFSFEKGKTAYTVVSGGEGTNFKPIPVDEHR
eukprot:9037095-Karenia_brevis.AAC.1